RSTAHPRLQPNNRRGLSCRNSSRHQSTQGSRSRARAVVERSDARGFSLGDRARLHRRRLHSLGLQSPEMVLRAQDGGLRFGIRGCANRGQRPRLNLKTTSMSRTAALILISFCLIFPSFLSRSALAQGKKVKRGHQTRTDTQNTNTASQQEEQE